MDWIARLTAYVPQSEAEAADQAMMLDYVNQYPDTVLLRENRACHFTASGLILSPDGRQVLMIYHNVFKTWSWTGGHCDGDPDFLAVALREAREETGMEGIRPLSGDIASLEILPVWGHDKRDQYVLSHLHLNVSYLLTADPASPAHPKEGENTDVRWLPADHLLEWTNEWQMDPVYIKLLDRAKSLLGN